MSTVSTSVPSKPSMVTDQSSFTLTPSVSAPGTSTTSTLKGDHQSEVSNKVALRGPQSWGSFSEVELAKDTASPTEEFRSLPTGFWRSSRNYVTGSNGFQRFLVGIGTVGLTGSVIAMERHFPITGRVCLGIGSTCATGGVGWRSYEFWKENQPHGREAEIDLESARNPDDTPPVQKEPPQ